MLRPVIPLVSERSVANCWNVANVCSIIKFAEVSYVPDTDTIKTAYTWQKPTTGDPLNLVEIDRQTTYHTYGYHGLFKPSCDEVLRQLPNNYPNIPLYFSTFPMDREGGIYYGVHGGPNCFMPYYWKERDDNHHVAITLIMKRDEPPDYEDIDKK